MELVFACPARLVGQRLICWADDRITNRTLCAFISLELGFGISLEEHECIEDKPVFPTKQLLHSKEPRAPLGLTHTHTLDIADFHTMQRVVRGQTNANFHRVFVDRVCSDDFVRG